MPKHPAPTQKRKSAAMGLLYSREETRRGSLCPRKIRGGKLPRTKGEELTNTRERRIGAFNEEQPPRFRGGGLEIGGKKQRRANRKEAKASHLKKSPPREETGIRDRRRGKKKETTAIRGGGGGIAGEGESMRIGFRRKHFRTRKRR